MEEDLFQKLAEQNDLPPPPTSRDLTGAVHHRVNKALLALHLIGFILAAVPLTALFLLSGIAHFFLVTLPGRADTKDE